MNIGGFFSGKKRKGCEAKIQRTLPRLRMRIVLNSQRILQFRLRATLSNIKTIHSMLRLQMS
jgi:hypothetical protein